MKKVTGRRTVLTYSYLYHSAYYSYEEGIEKERNGGEGSFYNFLNVIILLAFTIEAYLNHCGEDLIDYWDCIDRISTLDKLRVISEIKDIDFDTSKRPYQTIKKMINLRNTLAHGKTKNITGIIKYNSINEVSRKVPMLDWEKHCTEKSAKRFLNDTESVIKKIHSSIYKKEFPFFSLGHGIYG